MVRALTDYWLDKIEKYFPARHAARARVALAGPNYFYPFGPAMNGQTARLEATRQIVFRCGIRQIVETGTYRGTTTEWLAGFGLPVATIESHVPSYHFSKLRLRMKENVRVELGSSVKVMPELFREMDATLPTLFYLDAHWEEYLPLADEMQLIFPRFRSAVVLIDDFEVPGDAGYTYDDYGPGKALTHEYLAACVQPGMKIFYPSVPAEQETGRRRGWVVVTAEEMAARLKGVELLREYGAHSRACA